MNNTPQPASNSNAFLRTLSRVIFILAFALGAMKLLSWAMAQLDTHPNLMLGLTLLLLVCYALFISVPFVPAIEIGISIMIVKGPEAAIWVYIATVCGLYFAFMIGQLVPYQYLHKVFSDMRMKRACTMLESLRPLSAKDRLELLRSKAPKFIKPFIVEGRYVLVAAAINLPGNAVMGGGGGILMAAGLTRVFSSYWMLFTLLLAVSPVPIAILVFDIDPLSVFRGE